MVSLFQSAFFRIQAVVLESCIDRLQDQDVDRGVIETHESLPFLILAIRPMRETVPLEKFTDSSRGLVDSCGIEVAWSQPGAEKFQDVPAPEDHLVDVGLTYRIPNADSHEFLLSLLFENQTTAFIPHGIRVLLDVF